MDGTYETTTLFSTAWNRAVYILPTHVSLNLGVSLTFPFLFRSTRFQTRQETRGMGWKLQEHDAVQEPGRNQDALHRERQVHQFDCRRQLRVQVRFREHWRRLRRFALHRVVRRRADPTWSELPLRP